MVVGGYAAVALATPLERSGGLTLTGVESVPPARQFQRTVTTFVRGRLAPAWFGVTRLPGAFCRLNAAPCMFAFPGLW